MRRSQWSRTHGQRPKSIIDCRNASISRGMLPLFKPLNITAAPKSFLPRSTVRPAARSSAVLESPPRLPVLVHELRQAVRSPIPVQSQPTAPLGLRPPDRAHRVWGVAGDRGLRSSAGQRAGAKASSDDRLASEESVLDPALSIVAGLPPSPVLHPALRRSSNAPSLPRHPGRISSDWQR